MLELNLPAEIIYNILSFENYYQTEHKIKYQPTIHIFNKSPKYITYVQHNENLISYVFTTKENTKFYFCFDHYSKALKHGMQIFAIRDSMDKIKKKLGM